MEEIKTIKITVESFIDDIEGDTVVSSERYSSSLTAILKVTDNTLSLMYTESDDNGKTDTALTVSGEKITVCRSGALCSEFVFTEGEWTSSLYKAGEYSFDARIFTRKIRNNFTRTGGKLSILYDMTVGGADKRVRMKITSVGGAV
ncbi:MAG: DUF1934 domain-containing protein [Clostridia bacterium]|nr:DUF1934 domain-containing protein [Clostridia bacterium]